jgi:hypothetical protein
MDANSIISGLVANRFAEVLSSALSENGELWGIIDNEIKEQLSATPQEDAIIWLDESGSDKVCVTIFGADEPLVCGFTIPFPDIPIRKEYHAQVEQCAIQISNLRRFAGDVLKMADEAEKAMNDVLAGGEAE